MHYLRFSENMRCIVQVAAPADWAKGLPQGILWQIAGGRDALKAMRGVNKSWKAEFEGSVTHIEIPRKAPLPPHNGRLARLFPALSHLDIGDSQMKEGSLADLRGLTRLASLSLAPGGPLMRHNQETKKALGRILTGSGLFHLRHLPLTKLVLRGCQKLTNIGLQHLRGMQLAALDLGGCASLTLNLKP